MIFVIFTIVIEVCRCVLMDRPLDYILYLGTLKNGSNSFATKEIKKNKNQCTTRYKIFTGSKKCKSIAIR